MTNALDIYLFALVRDFPALTAVCENVKILADRAQMEKLKILLGCLGDPQSDMRIGFVDRCWTLATGEGDSYEVLCRHENWDQFVTLVHGHSDYVEGE